MGKKSKVYGESSMSVKVEDHDKKWICDMAYESSVSRSSIIRQAIRAFRKQFEE